MKIDNTDMPNELPIYFYRFEEIIVTLEGEKEAYCNTTDFNGIDFVRNRKEVLRFLHDRLTGLSDFGAFIPFEGPDKKYFIGFNARYIFNVFLVESLNGVEQLHPLYYLDPSLYDDADKIQASQELEQKLLDKVR